MEENAEHNGNIVVSYIEMDEDDEHNENIVASYIEMEEDDEHNENIAASNIEMEEDDKHNENIVASKRNFFSKEEDMIALLQTIFKHGYQDLPSDILPGKSEKERQLAMKSIYEQAKSIITNKPTIIDWLQSGLFVDEESHTSLALLLIQWYDKHPSSKEKNEECNFREIYHFIYKMMKNQPVPHLSHNSAKVLHTLLSEIINDVWPNKQNDVLNYLNEAYSYSRPGLRKTYSRKK